MSDIFAISFIFTKESGIFENANMQEEINNLIFMTVSRSFRLLAQKHVSTEFREARE